MVDLGNGSLGDATFVVEVEFLPGLGVVLWFLGLRVVPLVRGLVSFNHTVQSVQLVSQEPESLGGNVTLSGIVAVLIILSPDLETVLILGFFG